MDVAIVGGGVAGCYCAYRLAHDPAYRNLKIGLFEATGRIGGRLWSVPLRGVPDALPAEMGGMFISARHRITFELAIHQLKLDHRSVDVPRDRQFLRNTPLHDSDYYKKPDLIPFKLRASERGLWPVALLFSAIQSIAPELGEMWPLNPAATSPQDTFDLITTLQHKDGRPLSECGFWNVLSDVVSNEAYDLLLCTIGLGSFLRNANAAEALWTLLRDIGEQDFCQLTNGYQALPLTLLQKASGVEAYKQHTLAKIKHDGTSFVLRFDIPDGERLQKARKVILALPRLALERISYGKAVLADEARFRDLLSAVQPIPACKVFMTFDDAWWDRLHLENREEEGDTIRQAFTDLPMRQCFYYGKASTPGPAKLMAAYEDDVATAFWSGLANDPTPYASLTDDAAAADATRCSAAMVSSALDQLTTMHPPKKPELGPTIVPKPQGAAFVDWSRPPHGAAWHAWAPGRKGAEVAPQVRRPNPLLDLFVCGEAYSKRQGWVEGALSSAELALWDLGVSPPEWIDAGSVVFGENGGGKMANRLAELLIALGENLYLQKAFHRNPDLIMDGFGLTDEQKTALKSKKLSDVKEQAGNVGVFNITVSLVPSNDD